ncbi:unnamed protein product [Hymenolepis diminuta]|uniref:Uncharacterized protein n=1 Tax=Hymenolepis diminuta TaxID=6216 RepID=A0A564Z9A2_HYMDI|nr:unnamed protein product [Hymenolepis diminuta]
MKSSILLILFGFVLLFSLAMGNVLATRNRFCDQECANYKFQEICNQFCGYSLLAKRIPIDPIAYGARFSNF